MKAATLSVEGLSASQLQFKDAVMSTGEPGELLLMEEVFQRTQPTCEGLESDADVSFSVSELEQHARCPS